GHIDHMVRMAIREGLDPITAIQITTLNAAEYFNLHDRGAITPGRRADLVIFDNFEKLTVEQVYRGGQLVARNGRVLPQEIPPRHLPVRNSMNINWPKVDLRLPANGHKRVRVIDIVPDQIVTRQSVDDARIEHAYAVSDPARDLLKVAVIERHQATGNVGLGFVRGLKLKRGAIGSSVAHDSHNIIVAGTNDDDLMTAARAIAAMQGGLVAVADGQVLARVPLPIAGLMSDQPIERVRETMDDLVESARELGTDLHAPFMALAFLALPVIPELKLTDRGLVDVNKFDFVPVFAD
ncbi:MAG: adenine deaminase, partial [Chloroflexi bacterium]|nr:adenine deaminase [Chloroflexota bacterium]